MSFNLTGNKKNPAEDSQGKKSKYHVRVFEADAIESHRNVGLTRGGMILFALLSGGDYDNNKVRSLLTHDCGSYVFRPGYS
jgi:holliday junction resolvase YEN1